MKLSARTVLKRRIVGVVKGQTTARVKIYISPASITNEAVDDLELSMGDVGVIKASDVLIAKE